MGTEDTVIVDEFDKAFAEAVTDIEAASDKSDADKVIDAAASTDAAATDDAAKKAAEDAAAKTAADAAASAAKTAEQLDEEQKVADAAAAKAALDATKTPEQIAEEKKVADDAAKVEADAKAKADAEAKTKSDLAEAAAKAVADAQAVTDAAKKKEEQAQETPEQKKAREAFEESIKPYEPNEEEKKALALFEKEFPNEYAAVQAQFKTTDRAINARVYAAVQSVLQQVYKDVSPLARGVQENALKQHLAELHAAHADYDKVVGLVPAWIKTQPAYLQPAMQAVYDEGDTQSVIELIANFKAATGQSTTASDTSTAAGKAAAEAAAKATADAAAAAKAKAEADGLTPVGAKRTVTGNKGQADPNDFDGAFAEAAELVAASK